MNKKNGCLHLKVPLRQRHHAHYIWAMLCAATVLLFTGALVTYALLKTVTPTVTNVFQSDKNIRVTLDEPEWEDHGKNEAKAYVPGQKIDKDPTVTLETDSVDAYVALKVQYYSSNNQELTKEEFSNMYLNSKTGTGDDAGINYSDSWEYLGTVSKEKGDIYIYREILKQDNGATTELENVTEPLFTRVYLSKDIKQDNDTKKLPEFNIKITAYAIQADGVSYEEAKTTMYEFVEGL